MKLTNLLPERIFYRVNTPKWASMPASGAGAAAEGGRFNRAGVEALYLSLDETTALREYQQDDPIMPPGTIAAYHVALDQVVDFTAGYVSGEWGPIWEDWSCNWRHLRFLDEITPPSWDIGDLVLKAGVWSPQDMDVPGWRLHSLSRDLAGHWSVWVNGNWRMTFTFEGQNAVLVDYQDYHWERAMNQMHNPPHPGEILKQDVLPELGLSVTAAAEHLGMSRVALSRVLNGRAAISADFALRLADWLPPSAESWLRMQAAYDLWKASRKRRPKIKPASREAAA